MPRKNPVIELLGRVGFGQADGLFGEVNHAKWERARASTRPEARPADLAAAMKRKLARQDFRGHVEVRSKLSDRRSHIDRARDLSEQGIFVETAEPLDIGDPVVVTLQTPSGPVQVNGRVRWVSAFGRIDDPTPGMGIEFVGVDASKRSRIAQVIKETTP